ncbi:MAG TPA: hypothetical protein PKJ37_04465 [Acidobacteriota bacterium]|nr:hypothetical protein [Acidobacteriota bacterium]HNT17136.1 hypothetical protein [Acidobacteriota bacterium]
MKISIDAALRNGWTRMMTTLFRPFDFLKWLAIGFAAFLASLGRSKGFNFNFPSGGDFGSGDTCGSAKAFESWFFSNMWPIILFGLGIGLVVFAVVLLVVWLSSRGQFVFISQLLTNKADIREPWVKYGWLGDKLFLFRILFGLCVFLAVLLVLGAGVLLSFPYIKSGVFPMIFWMILIPTTLLLIAIALAGVIINAVLMDFVVPVMMKRETGVMQSFGTFRDEIFRGHLGDFVIFYLVKIGLSIAASVIMVLVTIFTCCLCLFMCIPILGWYVSAVIFLPISAFIRNYTLCFLEQFGDDWKLFTWKLHGDDPAPPPAPSHEEFPSAPAVQQEPEPSPEPPAI